jgi:hypothetical protein
LIIDPLLLKDGLLRAIDDKAMLVLLKSDDTTNVTDKFKNGVWEATKGGKEFFF